MTTIAQDAYRTARQLTEDVNLMTIWTRQFARQIPCDDGDKERLYEAMCRARFALKTKAVEAQRMAAQLHEAGL